eukprot:Gb_21583 [translate_table: standard]
MHAKLAKVTSINSLRAHQVVDATIVKFSASGVLKHALLSLRVASLHSLLGQGCKESCLLYFVNHEADPIGISLSCASAMHLFLGLCFFTMAFLFPAFGTDSTCEKTPVRVQRHGNFVDEYCLSIVFRTFECQLDKNECFRVCPSMPEYGRDASVNSGLVTRRQRKLKPDNSTNADDAFDDDLRCFNSTRNKKSTGNGQHPLNNRQIRNRRLSSRQSVSYSPTNYLSDEGELTSIDSKRSGHSTLSPFLGEENGCSRRAGKMWLKTPPVPPLLNWADQVLRQQFLSHADQPIDLISHELALPHSDAIMSYPSTNNGAFSI